MIRRYSIREACIALVLVFAPVLLAPIAVGQHVTFQNFTDAKAASNVLSIMVARPANTVAGDLLIAAVATDGNTSTSLSAPTGWNLISVETQLAVTFGVWWKIAGPSEPASYQFTWSLGEQSYAWIMRFTGHDPVSPINAVNTRGGTASLPASPAVTTTVVDTLILRMGGFDNPSITVGNTGLGGTHTTITMDRSSTTVGQAVSGGAGYRMLEAAGASGSANFSLTNTEAYRTVTIAIAPDRCTSNAECDDGNICTTDVCNEGFCENNNNNASCDDGNPCTTGDTCSGGSCQSGSPVDCSAAGDQCNTASCDPAGAPGNCSILTPVTNGTPCDDSDACNIGETCQSGVCSGGSAPDCSAEGDQCNTASCDPAGAPGNCSILTPVTNGTPCDDSDACNVGETCQSGVCTGGSASDCNAEGDQCNTASCDPAGAEGNCDTLTPVTNGTPCDDGNACNLGETCQSGVCTGGSAPDCSAEGDQCNTASCDPAGAEGNCDTLTPVTNGTPCDDADACNINESCQDGVCTGGSAPDCSAEGDQCNTASCDPFGTEGNCDTITPVTNGTTCDDALFCTAIDECVDGVCTGGGDPCPGQICVEASEECVDCLDNNDCDDGVGCTDDACSDGVCVFTPNDSHCDDGLFCNGEETCDPVLDCVPGEFPCDDGLECTENTCDELTNSCDFIPNDALCDDSNPCTIDTCNAGVCEYTFDGVVSIDVQIQGLSNAVTRDVTFVMTNCTGGVEIRTVPVSFDSFGFAMVQLVGVDADATWISAREGHTLRRLTPLAFTNCDAFVDFTGGDAPQSGDFHAGAATQDNIVDITDFSILASRWNTPIDPTLSTGADVTGDGFQSTADFTAIQTNFLQIGDPVDGCALSFTDPTSDELTFTRATPHTLRSKRTAVFGHETRAAATRRGIAPDEARMQSERDDEYLRGLRRTGVTRIPTAHLPIPHARAADVNDDGVIDARDIRAFAERHNISLTPEFDKLLWRLERIERQNDRR